MQAFSWRWRTFRKVRKGRGVYALDKVMEAVSYAGRFRRGAWFNRNCNSGVYNFWNILIKKKFKALGCFSCRAVWVVFRYSEVVRISSVSVVTLMTLMRCRDQAMWLEWFISKLSTFVRVLHFHLKKKLQSSTSSCQTGTCSLENIQPVCVCLIYIQSETFLLPPAATHFFRWPNLSSFEPTEAQPFQ